MLSFRGVSWDWLRSTASKRRLERRIDAQIKCLIVVQVLGYRRVCVDCHRMCFWS